MAASPNNKICSYYASPKGCHKGKKCPFKHVAKKHSNQLCKYYESNGGCKHGASCKYTHANNKKNDPYKKSNDNKTYYFILQQLYDKWYKNKDVNVRNLGIYLKNVVFGYQACIDKKVNFGYVKFGTYSRTFCEVSCNYILKEKGNGMTLKSKMDLLKVKIKGFPYNEMNYIRVRTNRIVHGVPYNEDAKKRFIEATEQQQILINICRIATWLRVK